MPTAAAGNSIYRLVGSNIRCYVSALSNCAFPPWQSCDLLRLLARTIITPVSSIYENQAKETEREATSILVHHLSFPGSVFLLLESSSAISTWMLNIVPAHFLLHNNMMQPVYISHPPRIPIMQLFLRLLTRGRMADFCASHLC